MSDVQTVRRFVLQRLTAAAEEISGLFERTVAEYEERLRQQRKLLDAVHKLHTTDVQHLLVGKEEGEQLQWLEEAPITIITVVPVKSEDDDEEKPQFFQHHPTEQMEIDGDDRGGRELAGTSDPDQLFPPDRTQNDEVSVKDKGLSTGQTADGSSGCVKTFGHETQNGTESVGKAFSCPICGKRYPRKDSLMTHMRLHSEGKWFNCSVCRKRFQWRAEVVRHMRVHTGERPFCCSICGTRFTVRSDLAKHMSIHASENPVTYSVWKESFSSRRSRAQQMRTHRREKTLDSARGRKNIRLQDTRDATSGRPRRTIELAAA